jgi:hypothetical protein
MPSSTKKAERVAAARFSASMSVSDGATARSYHSQSSARLVPAAAVRR